MDLNHSAMYSAEPPKGETVIASVKQPLGSGYRGVDGEVILAAPDRQHEGHADPMALTRGSDPRL